MTYCTGKRNPVRSCSASTGTASRCSSSVGPGYQGVCAERAATLSPSSAETGIVVTAPSAQPSALVSAANSLAITVCTASSKSIRSILLTASTSRGTPSSASTAAWRRGCSPTPLRGAAGRTAQFAGGGAGEGLGG